MLISFSIIRLILFARGNLSCCSLMGRLALRRSQKAAGPREILIRCKTGKAVMTTVLPVGLHSAKTLRAGGFKCINKENCCFLCNKYNNKI